MHFYTHESIPLSKIVIFFGSLSSFFLNLKLTHPVRNTKALDFNMIILICPNLLMGTVLGVTLNKILPNIIIIFLLTILLFYNTYKTFKVGIKEYENENNAMKNISAQSSIKNLDYENNNGGLNSNSNLIENPLNDPIDEEIKKESIFNNGISKYIKRISNNTKMFIFILVSIYNFFYILFNN